MNSCIVKPHRAGLFSLINKVVTCAEIYQHVHVDFTEGTLYSEPGDNLWNHMFHPTVDLGGKIITGYPHVKYTFSNSAALYEMKDIGWRKRLRSCFSWFPLLPEFQFYFDETNVCETIGVQVPSTVHAGEQPSGKLPSLEDYRVAIDRELLLADERLIYLACSSDETLHWFQREYGDRLRWNKNARRSEKSSVEFHVEVKQTVRDAKECFRDVLQMSRCETLIHPVSNMATAALYMNPDLKSVYLRRL